MSEPTIVVVGHGSRVPGANHAFETLVDRYRRRHRDRDVTHGYIELAEPSLDQALAIAARRTRRIVVAPLFLLAAGHVKNDIPLALARARRRFPGVDFEAAAPIGVHAGLADLAHARAREALGGDLDASTAIAVIGRGASDPDANGDFYKIARLVGEGRPVRAVLPCFAGIAAPRFGEALELAARLRPQRLVAVPYLFFAGRLQERLSAELDRFAANHPWIRTVMAGPLGLDDAVLDALGDRIEAALAGRGALPCDTCQYRRPIAGVVDEVDGLRALLWSVRHTVTHTQAAPHEHAHAPLRKHVLVCGNVDCAGRGSIPLIRALRRRIKAAGRQAEIRVTRTSCLGRCGEGPTVTVYPDGVWYRGVDATDAADLVDEHLLADRLVARLVDDVMQ